MKILTLIFSAFFSILAVAIMTYISMATPIGPWIEMTIAFLSIIVFYFLSKNLSSFTHSVGLTTAAAGIGGILATGFGFSLPALHFTDPHFFSELIAKPAHFYALCASLALSAGSLGFLIADLLEERLIVKQALPFPIGELMYNTIFSGNRLRQALELFTGFLGIQLLFLINSTLALVRNTITVWNKISLTIFSIPEVAFALDQLPLYISVGFVTGHVIAIPLIAGFLAKTFIIDPLYYVYTQPSLFAHALFYPFGLVSTGISLFEFTLAFGSGIVLWGTFATFFNVKKLKRFFTGLRDRKLTGWQLPDISFLEKTTVIKIILTLAINSAFLTYFQFSFLTQCYVIAFTIFCIMQMLIIAGQIGIVPLGRFATFVMVPGILLFGFSSIQAILVATFVEIAGGVAADALFGRKFAQLAQVDKNRMRFYQLWGLIIACAAIGLIFWLFASRFSFDTCGLPVVKAASRALLINIKSFDMYILFLGFVSGFFLKFTKINSALLLGGILMPPSVSLMLILGGILSFVTKNKEMYYPFLSGISAGCVVWIMLQAIVMMFTRAGACALI